MSAMEARKITNESLEMLKKLNLMYAESFRKAYDNKIEEAARRGKNRCSLKLAKSINDEILNNIIRLLQKDDFSAYKEGDNIIIKW